MYITFFCAPALATTKTGMQPRVQPYLTLTIHAVAWMSWGTSVLRTHHTLDLAPATFRLGFALAFYGRISE